jgi:hypothetical protein
MADASDKLLPKTPFWTSTKKKIAGVCFGLLILVVIIIAATSGGSSSSFKQLPPNNQNSTTFTSSIQSHTSSHGGVSNPVSKSVIEVHATENGEVVIDEKISRFYASRHTPKMYKSAALR